MSQLPASGSVRLTVAVIVRDAAEALAETLESVGSVADELVVLDTGSTDRTCEVAAEYGAVVRRGAWDEDFSAARNTCWDAASGQWLLWLDAGERLSAEAAGQLGAFLREGAEPSTAYMLLIKVPPQAGEGEGEQAGRIRLVPNRPDLRFTGRVRESLNPALARLGLAVEGLPYVIERGAGQHDGQAKVRRARRHIRLAELEIRETGEQPHLLNCLGDAFQMLGDNDRSVEFFRAALALSQPGSGEMLEAYYGLLTSLDGTSESREVQLSLCMAALEHFPMDAQLLCALGGYLQGQQRWDLAARAYEVCYRHGQVHPELWHLDGVREVAAVCCALALQLQDRNQQAEQVLAEAAAEYPQSRKLQRRLLELYIKQGRRDEALEQLDRCAPKPGLEPGVAGAESSKPQRAPKPGLEALRSAGVAGAESSKPQRAPKPGLEALRSAVRGACLAARENWIAARAYLETAYQAGCRDPLCLRWLAVTLLSLAQTDQARTVLQQWKQVEPTNEELALYLEALGDQHPAQPQRDQLLRVDRGTTPSPHTELAAKNVDQNR